MKPLEEIWGGRCFPPEELSFKLDVNAKNISPPWRCPRSVWIASIEYPSDWVFCLDKPVEMDRSFSPVSRFTSSKKMNSSSGFSKSAVGLSSNAWMSFHRYFKQMWLLVHGRLLDATFPIGIQQKIATSRRHRFGIGVEIATIGQKVRNPSFGVSSSCSSSSSSISSSKYSCRKLRQSSLSCDGDNTS